MLKSGIQLTQYDRCQIQRPENVLKSPLVFLQNHLKRGSCRDALYWCFRRDPRLLLLDAATFVGNEVLDFLLHVRPIELGSSQVHHAICTKVIHVNVELLVNSWFDATGSSMLICGVYSMLLSNSMLFESRFSVLLMGDIPVSCMLPITAEHHAL